MATKAKAATESEAAITTGPKQKHCDRGQNVATKAVVVTEAEAATGAKASTKAKVVTEAPVLIWLGRKGWSPE